MRTHPHRVHAYRMVVRSRIRMSAWRDRPADEHERLVLIFVLVVASSLTSCTRYSCLRNAPNSRRITCTTSLIDVPPPPMSCGQLASLVSSDCICSCRTTEDLQVCMHTIKQHAAALQPLEPSLSCLRIYCRVTVHFCIVLPPVD